MIENGGISGTLSADLLFHITCDSNCNDISGNNTIVNITGTATYVSDRDGINKAVLFPTTGHYMWIANPYPDLATKKSTTFFFYSDGSDTPAQSIFSLGDSYVDNTPALLIQKYGVSLIRVYRNGQYSAGIPIKIGLNCIGINFSSVDQGELYLNGIKIDNISLNTPNGHSSNIYFAAGYPTTYTQYIDEIRCYKRYLTSTEMKEISDMGVNFDASYSEKPSVTYTKLDNSYYRRTIKYGTYNKKVKVTPFLASYFKDGSYSSGKPVNWVYDINVPTLRSRSEYTNNVAVLETGQTTTLTNEFISVSDVEVNGKYEQVLFLIEDYSSPNKISRVVHTTDFSYGFTSQSMVLTDTQFKLASSYPNFDTNIWNVVDGVHPSLILEQRGLSSTPFKNETMTPLTVSGFSLPINYINLSSDIWSVAMGSIPSLKSSQIILDNVPFTNNIMTEISDDTFKDLSLYTENTFINWIDTPEDYPELTNDYAISDFPSPNIALTGKDGLTITLPESKTKAIYSLDIGSSRWDINENVTQVYLSPTYVLSSNPIEPNISLTGKDGLTITLPESKTKAVYSLDIGTSRWNINENVTQVYLSPTYIEVNQFTSLIDGKDGLTITLSESKTKAVYNIFSVNTRWDINEDVTQPFLSLGYLESLTFPNMSEGLDGTVLSSTDAIKKDSYSNLDFTNYFIIPTNKYPALRVINLPSMDINSGEYKNGIESTFLCDENGIIKYTIDGSDPRISDTANSASNNDTINISKTTNIQLAQVYSFGVSDIVTYNYTIVSDVPLMNPYFPFKYSTMDAIAQYDNVNDIKFNFYEAIFAIIDSNVDISLGIPNKRLLSIVTNHFFDIDKDLVLVNDIPLDFFEDSLTIVQENDFIYVAGDFISKLESINSIKILQADRYFTKQRGIFNKITDTQDNTFIRIKKDGTIIFDNQMIITEDVILLNILTDVIVLNPRTLITDPDILVANYGFGIRNGKMSNISIEKINQNTIYNTSTDTIALIPYLRDENNKSYYENFTSTYSQQIYSHIPNFNLIQRDEYDKFIHNLKENKGIENQDNYTDELNKIYQHDIGLYEKMLIEDIKNHFIIKRDKFDIIRDTIKLPWSNTKVLLNSVSVLLHITVDNEEKLPLEVYCNRLRLPVEPECIDMFGVTHMYIDIKSCFDDIFRYVYDSTKPNITFESFILKYRSDIKLLFNVYEDMILDHITISVIKKRDDFKSFNTGYVEWNKGYVEIYNSFEDGYGTSVFLDGLLLNSNDYYIEIIGGVVCLFFKRKIDKEKVNVSITYYERPIYISDNIITYTDNTFMNTLTYLDEIYVNGQLVTRDDIYTLDTTKNILKVKVNDVTEYDNTDIRIRTYYDKSIYESYLDKDYRTKLINNLDMLSYIESLHKVKKSLNNVNRNYKDKSLEEYIFYLKYMINSEYEKKDVYISTSEMSDIPGYAPFTEEEIILMKKKYKNLFDENGCIVYVSQSDDSDYPRDIIIGDTYGETDLETYKYTIELSKLNSISKYPEDCIINNNYHGETIK